MKITNKIHIQILKDISQLKTDCSSDYQWPKNYLGTDKIYHGFSTGQMIDLVKKIIKENNLDEKQTIDLLNSLYINGKSYTEIGLAAMILSRSSDVLKNFDPKHLDLWLNYTCGWAENDVLCQSNFSSDILFSNWSDWEKIINQFVKDKNINKRRASLVLLTKSLRQSDDPRLSKLAFQNIEKLKSEKEILITKAVSWLLRSLTKFHRDEVLIYLDKNKDSLPKIAYREAFAKATTGRKYNKKI
ncbi:MAG: DNA alkylation repair protein [Candidatus Shapirobacteria bacterium]|nr:DNA alkylation repair protein [Candidatus Shapirobacteria bacterium]MDD3002427.1 DNA alkylation repair protein [Candidatus Shapirobacteria bacterium]MDD4383442.1 DNA alkylation repair protein [Candidatus Shapirobacteria bacterium]